MNPTLAYPFHGALYLNLTNRCQNDCTFCLRRHHEGVGGHRLWLAEEPSAAEVLAAVGDPRPFREIVFCGFGEPLLRVEVVAEVAAALKARASREGYPLRIRVDTNGLANAVHGRNVLPELAGLVDAVSISLNAPTAEQYERLCRPTVPGAYAALLDFIREAVACLPEVTLTAVAVPGVDLEACRRLAERLGAGFRVRGLIGEDAE
ncbi:MAG: TatD family nuclease-associated radical SAM protein [Chitinophagales bacterium]